MSFINRSHVTDTPTRTVRWDTQLGALTYSRRNGDRWGSAPIQQPFGYGRVSDHARL